jgi:hypothetical protein
VNGHLDLSTLVLHKGAHEASPEFCIMEATAVWLGEKKKDRDIDAVCPRIEAYGRALNDYMPDAQRQRLVTFIPRLQNTKAKTQAEDDARRWMLQETATKIFAASAMRAAGLMEHAETLSQCVVTDKESSDLWAAGAARAARAAWAAGAAGAAGAAWAAGAAGAARSAGAAGSARAAGSAEAEVWETAIGLLDRLIRVTEAA